VPRREQKRNPRGEKKEKILKSRWNHPTNFLFWGPNTWVQEGRSFTTTCSGWCYSGEVREKKEKTQRLKRVHFSRKPAGEFGRM